MNNYVQRNGTGRRAYRLKQRAQQMDETAQRIAQAAFELHASIGPSKTTISAIAEKAGVQRLTVYRHYPDDLSLFRACVDHGLSVLPLPDPRHWEKIQDSEDRLRRGLVEMYAYYRRTEPVWSNILPDLPRMPALWRANARTFESLGQIHSTLAGAWRSRGRKRGLIEAAIWLALQFSTWQTLVRQRELTDKDASEVMVASIRCLAGQQSRR